MNLSTSTVPQQRRRRTQGLVEEEDAASLKLGPEFDVKQIDHDGAVGPLIALNLSEARILIKEALKRRKKELNGEDVNENDDEVGNDDDADLLGPGTNEVIRKTVEYLNIFARFKDPETISAVDQLLKSREASDLHPFEIAQLGSLACDEADEAKTLISSLAGKKSDEELQVILNQLRRLEAPL